MGETRWWVVAEQAEKAWADGNKEEAMRLAERAGTLRASYEFGMEHVVGPVLQEISERKRLDG